jgi:rhamnosyltransferase
MKIIETNKDLSVCGMVMLYNPKMEVLGNIESYLNQVELLLIIDNSEVKNEKLISILIEINKIKYIDNKGNLGVSRALNQASELAISLGFKFLLTMDQDSKAPEDMVRDLLLSSKELQNVGIVSPLHADKFNTHLKFNGIVNKLKVVKTSGNIINLDAFLEIGEFDKDLFIDYVDIEYCYRLKQNKYGIYRINNIILEHNEADIDERKFLNKKYYPYNHQPFRFYYKTRNMLYLCKKYTEYRKELINSYLRIIVKVILFEEYKYQKIKMSILGLVDFIRNRFGKKF